MDMKKGIRRWISACGLLFVSALCFILIMPDAKASAYDYELKTSANRIGKVVKEDEVVGDS